MIAEIVKGVAVVVRIQSAVVVVLGEIVPMFSCDVVGTTSGATGAFKVGTDAEPVGVAGVQSTLYAHAVEFINRGSKAAASNRFLLPLTY